MRWHAVGSGIRFHRAMTTKPPNIVLGDNWPASIIVKAKYWKWFAVDARETRHMTPVRVASVGGLPHAHGLGCPGYASAGAHTWYYADRVFVTCSFSPVSGESSSGLNLP